MDNITHTLSGLLMAEALLALRKWRSPASASPREATLLVSVLANNAPDLDITYKSITAGKLGYLLHHRGHTHTVLATIPLAVLCLLIALVVLRLAGQVPSRRHGWDLLAVAVIGVGLHLVMDLSNNYGLHPLWPVDNSWYYGDTFYIVEPWLILTLCGAAFGSATGRASMVLPLLCAGALIYLAFLSDAASVGLRLLLSGFAVSWLWLLRIVNAQQRLMLSGGALALLLSVQLWARSAASAHLDQALAADALALTVDRVMTPAPANPLCWSSLIVQRSGEEHVVRRAMVSAWPAVWNASRCLPLDRTTTAPLGPTQMDDSDSGRSVVWRGEFRAPLSELSQLVQDDCRAAAAARFMRVPYWTSGSPRILGDLRFDRSAALGFAELRLTPGLACPRHVPPWRPPFRTQ